MNILNDTIEKEMKMEQNFYKVISAHQPCYIPWLGFVDKLVKSDIFVFMDDVKFSKNSMYARNYIRINNKKMLLTVPTRNADKNKLIKDVGICESNWHLDHINKIKIAYSKSNFYKLYIDEIEAIYQKKWNWLCELNYEFLLFIKKIFKISSEIKIASHFSFEGDKNSRLINYCNKFKASTYIFGKNGKRYADEEKFRQNNINIVFQDFKCPNENLSFLDYIFNFGPENCEFFGER